MSGKKAQLLRGKFEATLHQCGACLDYDFWFGQEIIEYQLFTAAMSSSNEDIGMVTYRGEKASRTRCKHKQERVSVEQIVAISIDNVSRFR